MDGDIDVDALLALYRLSADAQRPRVGFTGFAKTTLPEWHVGRTCYPDRQVKDRNRSAPVFRDLATRR